MVGERQIGHVVVPDGVVQAERLVALAPGIARPLVLLDDDGGNAEALQPRAQRDAALAAADDDALGLARMAELRFLARLALGPAFALADEIGRASCRDSVCQYV